MDTFGTVTFKDGKWRIQCEPHVRTRLKRVFPRAPQSPGEVVVISANPENSRELEWFLQRYPMKSPDAARMAALSAEFQDMELRLADLLAARRPPSNVTLAVPPREYQRIVPDVLAIRKGLLLGDDVGLGKTVSAICCMVTPGALPALVVCPAHMPRHWVRFIARFAPALRVHRIRDGGMYSLLRSPKGRQPDLWPDALPDVIVVSYHKLRKWSDTLAGVCRLVVFDECQQLRRYSEIYKACSHVAEAAELRLGLSATPIYNYGMEFFHVIEPLIPGALGDRSEFWREWCQAGFGDKARIADTAEFGAYLRRAGIMLRRTRKQVKQELPEVERIPVPVESDSEQLERIKGDAVALARIMLAQQEQQKGDKMRAAGELDVLVRKHTGIAKAPYVAAFVRLLVENGEKVVLFGWHLDVYAIWKEQLADLKPVMYTGEQSTTQKDASIDAFVHGDSKVLIMSLRSGAGTDGLQFVCSTVVFGELDWSPGVHEQCIGRVDRDGQTEPVVAYFLISDEGSDPIVQGVLGVKREQIEGVRNPGEDLVQRSTDSTTALRELAKAYLSAQEVPA